VSGPYCPSTSTPSTRCTLSTSGPCMNGGPMTARRRLGVCTCTAISGPPRPRVDADALYAGARDLAHAPLAEVPQDRSVEEAAARRAEARQRTVVHERQEA